MGVSLQQRKFRLNNWRNLITKRTVGATEQASRQESSSLGILKAGLVTGPSGMIGRIKPVLPL